MEKTLYSATELSKRWGVSISHVATLESNGLLTRTKVGRATYPVDQVRKLEEYKKTSPTLDNIRHLKEENRKLKFENENYKEIIKGYQKILGGF